MQKSNILFPLKQLNLILDCIRPETVYHFNFITNECFDKKHNEKLLKMFNICEKVYAKSVEKFYSGMIKLFTFKDDNIITIDVNKIAGSVRKYFNANPDLNLEKRYSDSEIYDFLDYFLDNPVCAEMKVLINKVPEKKGSIFVFQFFKEDKDLFDELIFADIPANFKKINIDFSFTGNVFDLILEQNPNNITEYPYPFSILDEPGKLEEIKQKKYQLIKNALVEVNVDPPDVMKKNGIWMQYSFNLRFDCLTGKLI